MPTTWPVGICRHTGNRVSKGRNHSDPGTLTDAIRSKNKKSPNEKKLMDRRLGNRLPSLTMETESGFMLQSDFRHSE
jgi:hypothetical protein